MEAGGRWRQTYLYAISGSESGGTWPYLSPLQALLAHVFLLRLKLPPFLHVGRWSLRHCLVPYQAGNETVHVYMNMYRNHFSFHL